LSTDERLGRRKLRSPPFDWLPLDVGVVGVGVGVDTGVVIGTLLEEASLTGVLGTEVATLAGVTVAGVTLKLPEVVAELVAGTAAGVTLEFPLELPLELLLELLLELSQRPWHSTVVVVLVLPV
jgi:hypothetical protein